MGDRRLRGRDKRLRRQEKRTVLIVTNGAVTEQTYLREIKQRALRTARERGEELSIRVEFVNGETESIIRKLSSPHGDTRAYDEVWLVVDEDGSDREKFLRDCAKAARKQQSWTGIVSRPCFEVWLIAHYEQVRRYGNQRDAQQHLRRLMPSHLGDKELPTDFPYDAIGEAIKRSRLPGEDLGEPRHLPSNPGSAMPHLVIRLGLGQ